MVIHGSDSSRGGGSGNGSGSDRGRVSDDSTCRW